MKKVISKDYLKGIRVGKSEVMVSYLQYADDTLFISETYVKGHP